MTVLYLMVAESRETLHGSMVKKKVVSADRQRVETKFYCSGETIQKRKAHLHAPSAPTLGGRWWQEGV